MKSEVNETHQLWISQELAERIGQHGTQTYPYECCGAMLGRDASVDGKDNGRREVLELLPLTNRRDDSPRNRFAVTPRDVLDADKAAQQRGLEIVGWYHSHPDHPARPSEYDREHAWPWYSYVIVSVEHGKPADMRSWQLKLDRSGYEEEEIEIRRQEVDGVDVKEAKDWRVTR
jgi:proteasome lid subunit RPN8/RPN11